MKDVEAQMVKVATNLAATNDLIQQEQDRFETMQRETPVFIRKAEYLKTQINQEVQDKATIIAELHKLY